MTNIKKRINVINIVKPAVSKSLSIDAVFKDLEECFIFTFYFYFKEIRFKRDRILKTSNFEKISLLGSIFKTYNLMKI